MMKAIALSLVTLCACAKQPPSKQAVAELAIRVTQLSSDAVTRAISPIETFDVNVPCDSGRMQVRSTVDGAARRDEIDVLACRIGGETLSGHLTVDTLSMVRTGASVNVVQELNGALAYEGPTYAGNFTFDALRLSTTIEVVDGRLIYRSSMRGSVTVGGTRYAYDNETYEVVDTHAPTGGGSASGGGSAGGMSSAGGTAGATRITGVSGVTDLAVVGQTAFFTGEVSSTQPGVFSANATSTAATLLCTGPSDSKLAGVVVDGANVYALMSSSSGTTKLLRTTTTATGGACQELGSVDAKGFFLTALAAMAKVGDGLVYLANDGSLKSWSLSGNAESVLAGTQGGSFFEGIASTGSIGVVAQAAPGIAPPNLKTFTSAGLGETLASFSAPEFTTLGTRVLWAIDGASGAVSFRYRDASMGSAESTGATAQLGVPGRINLRFCETNDGSAAGFAIAKSSDAAAGFYAIGADTNAPRKLTSQAFDAPVHCAITTSRLWVVEGDLGGSRNLLRFAR